MDSLSSEKQAAIKKISTNTLVAKLIKAGYDEEVVVEMDRDQLIAELAECVLADKDQPSIAESAVVVKPTVAMTDHEMQK